MNLMEQIESLLRAIDEQMARCHRIETGLGKATDGVALLSDEASATMPENYRTTYMRAALNHIAVSPDSK